MADRPNRCPRCHRATTWWQWRQRQRPDGTVQRLCATCAQAVTTRDAAIANIRERLK